MTNVDIGIFELLAALFTLSFMVLCYFIFRFLQGLEHGRNELLRVAYRLEENWSPILADLRVGASRFRQTGELAREGAEKFADLGEKASQLSNLTKFGAKGIWAILAQIAGTFLNRRNGDRHD